MKKIRFTGKIRYLGMALTVIQGIMRVVIAIFFLNERYMEVWRRYPEDGQTLTVYMQDLSQEASSGVESFLTGTADAGQLFIARKDTAMENDGTWGGFVLGVYGDPSGKDVALDFLNEEILSQCLGKCKPVAAEDFPHGGKVGKAIRILLRHDCSCSENS